MKTTGIYLAEKALSQKNRYLRLFNKYTSMLNMYKKNYYTIIGRLFALQHSAMNNMLIVTGNFIYSDLHSPPGWPESGEHQIKTGIGGQPGKEQMETTESARETGDENIYQLIREGIQPEYRTREGGNENIYQLIQEGIQSEYSTLDTVQKSFFEKLIEKKIPLVRIFLDQRNERLLRMSGADAVNYENNIFLGHKYVTLNKIQKIALLGHELTHAAHSKINESGTHTGLPAGMNEEKLALANERKVLHLFNQNYLYNTENKGPGFTGIDQDQSSQGKQGDKQETPIKTAPVNRDTDLPDIEFNQNTQPVIPADVLNSIKEEIYEEILQRILVDFERGG